MRTRSPTPTVGGVACASVRYDPSTIRTVTRYDVRAPAGRCASPAPAASPRTSKVRTAATTPQVAHATLPESAASRVATCADCAPGSASDCARTTVSHPPSAAIPATPTASADPVTATGRMRARSVPAFIAWGIAEGP
jgi:hypothetical protein